MLASPILCADLSWANNLLHSSELNLTGRFLVKRKRNERKIDLNRAKNQLHLAGWLAACIWLRSKQIQLETYAAPNEQSSHAVDALAAKPASSAPSCTALHLGVAHTALDHRNDEGSQPRSAMLMVMVMRVWLEPFDMTDRAQSQSPSRSPSLQL